MAYAEDWKAATAGSIESIRSDLGDYDRILADSDSQYWHLFTENAHLANSLREVSALLQNVPATIISRDVVKAIDSSLSVLAQQFREIINEANTNKPQVKLLQRFQSTGFESELTKLNEAMSKIVFSLLGAARTRSMEAEVEANTK